MRNLKLAFRTLFRTPFITAIAVLSIALGIGANAAIFSLFDQMLLRPLPVREPDRLVNFYDPGPKPGGQSWSKAGDSDAVFSLPMFRDLERAETGLSGIAAHHGVRANIAFGERTLSGEVMLVSGSYFPVLGLNPALGRLFGPDDDKILGQHPLAVLSYRYWQNSLGADPAVLNKTITVNGEPFTVIGVAPRGFEGTTLGQRPQVFVPISMAGELVPWGHGIDSRTSHWAYLFGRLKPGMSMEQAQASVNAVFRPIVNDVEAQLQQNVSEQTMKEFRAKEIVLEAGARGQSTLHGEVRTPLILLFATTGVVLLIACANIANLLLARGANRKTEMAVRLALGARRRQVIGQLLTESLVLAVLGGAASLLVAEWTLIGIAAILPPDSAAMLHLGLRWPVVLFAAALAVGTGLLFGLFPALHNTRSELVSAIRAGAGQIAGARSAAFFRGALVTAQIALSMALLISAGLFLKSLVNLSRLDLGLRVEEMLTFAIAPGLNGYEPERSKLLFERVEEELAALPGVTAVTAAMFPILTGEPHGEGVSVEGFTKGPDTDVMSQINIVGPEFFETLGAPLIAGREFTAADRIGTPTVVVVNEAFAKKFNLGTDAVGKRMAFGDNPLSMEIVGLVRDAKLAGVKEEVPPFVVLAYRQVGEIPELRFYVRTTANPAQSLRAVTDVVARLDPNLPVRDLKTMPQQVRENVFLDRMIGTLSAAFAALATLLAAIGLYGVLAYTVAQRTREIGVRMALGADGRQVRGMILRQVGKMLLIGTVIGLIAALVLGRAVASLLYAMESNDPLVILAAVALLALVTLGAGYIPALRASRVDPVQALRYE